MTARPLPARLDPRATAPTLRGALGLVGSFLIGVALAGLTFLAATAVALLPGALFVLAVLIVGSTAVALAVVAGRRIKATG